MEPRLAEVWNIDMFNKKSYNVLKHDNGRYCWMAIRRMK